jgi:hypothetical protein
MSGDRIQPRADALIGFEVVAVLVKSDKCRLKDLFGTPGVVQVLPKIIKKLALIATHQFAERRLISRVAILQKKSLVAQRQQFLPRRK